MHNLSVWLSVSEKEKVSIKWKPVLVFLGCVRFQSQESITVMRNVRLSTSKTCHRLIGTSMNQKWKKTLMWMQSSWSAWHCEHLELSSPAHHHNSHALLLSFEGNCSCNTSSRLWTKLRRISKRSGLDEHYQKVEETRKQGQTTQLQIELHNFTSSTCHMAKSNIQWQRYATNQKHRILY